MWMCLRTDLCGDKTKSFPIFLNRKADVVTVRELSGVALRFELIACLWKIIMKRFPASRLFIKKWGHSTCCKWRQQKEVMRGLNMTYLVNWEAESSAQFYLLSTELHIHMEKLCIRKFIAMPLPKSPNWKKRPKHLLYQLILYNKWL